MNKHRLIAIGAFSSLLMMGLLAAVVFFRAKIVVTNSPAELSLADHWTSNENCSPPCWEGIRPGMAAVTALKLLKQDQNATGFGIHNYDTIGIGEISWNWINSSADSRIFYRGNPLENGKVYAILPGFTCCIHLEKVIGAFGTPDFVYIRETPSPLVPTSVYFTYTLIWIEKGFCVKGGPQTGTKIDQDFSIDTIVFFKPSMDGYLLYEGNAGKGALPWHGYDEAKGYLSP